MSRVGTFHGQQSALLNLQRAQSREAAAGEAVSTQRKASDLKGFGREAENVTALKSVQARVVNWQAQADATEDPRDKVLAIFDAVSVFRATAQPTQWCTFLATASERPTAADVPADLVARDTTLLQEGLRRYAEAADPSRADEIVAVVTLSYNGVLGSLLRGTPGDPAPLGRRIAASALGWPSTTARPS